MIKKLFTSRNRIKLLEYFIFGVNSGKLREIASETKIPISAVSRELKNLVELEIVKKVKGDFSLNKKCSFVDDLKNILLKTDSIVYPLRKIVASKKIKYALIFGSFADRSYGLESDIDLLIIGNVKFSEVVKLIHSFEGKIMRDINPVVWKLDELEKKKGGKFVKEIFAGKVLMLKGDENELRKIIRK